MKFNYFNVTIGVNTSPQLAPLVLFSPIQFGDFDEDDVLPWLCRGLMVSFENCDADQMQGVEHQLSFGVK